MRKLMWFTLGFGAVCALWAYTLPGRGILIGACGLLLLLIGSALLARRWPRAYIASLIFAGGLAGLGLFFGFQQLYLAPISPFDGTTQTLTVTASDFSQESGSNLRLDGVTELDGRTVKVRAYLREDVQLWPGDRVTAQFRLRLTSPDGQEESSYHASTGIFYLAYQSGPGEYETGDPNQAQYFPVRLREGIKTALHQAFPADAYPFAVALLLGDTSGLDYQTNNAFRISGIAHVVAVSGMHVAVLYGALQLLSFKRRYLTALLTVPAVLIFTAVAGFTPSVTRASLMVLLTVLGQALNREYDAPTALSFASLVMLCVNPFVITSVSFQLSVGCVAGILLFSGRIHGWITAQLPKLKPFTLKFRLMQSFSLSVSVTLGSISLITPLCAYYFGSVSIIGILANLVTLWAANLLFYGIILIVLLSLISTTLASALGSCFAWLARYVVSAAMLLARVPLAAVYTQSVFIIAWLIFTYVLLAVFLLQRKKQPLALLCCAMIGLCIAVMASWAQPLMGGTRLTVLDVGQGQCILVQSQGQELLIDCGGDKDEDTADLAARHLLSQGISALDALVITHGDKDHAGGVPYLLSRVSVDHLLLPDTLPACTGRLQTLTVGEDISFTLGQCRITVFAPPMVQEDNENSLCVLVQGPDLTALITGDRSAFGEGLLLYAHDLPDVDILIAGHHGSKHATSQALLEAVKPETVVISVSESNPYGHPAPELLQRLQDYGCRVLRTDTMGTIVLTSRDATDG